MLKALLSPVRKKEDYHSNKYSQSRDNSTLHQEDQCCMGDTGNGCKQKASAGSFLIQRTLSYCCEHLHWMRLDHMVEWEEEWPRHQGKFNIHMCSSLRLKQSDCITTSFCDWKTTTWHASRVSHTMVMNIHSPMRIGDMSFCVTTRSSNTASCASIVQPTTSAVNKTQ